MSIDANNIVELKPTTRKPCKKQSGGSSLREVSDTRTGPLAEARAISDVLNLVATDQLMPLEDTMPTLTRMLVERLSQVQRVIDAEVTHG